MTEQHLYHMAWEIARAEPNVFERIYAISNRHVITIDVGLPARSAAATLRPPPTDGTFTLVPAVRPQLGNSAGLRPGRFVAATLAMGNRGVFFATPLSVAGPHPL